MALILRILLVFSIFITNNAQETIKLLNLTQENPSFAIHGVRLKDKQAIMLEGCDLCNLLIDVTLRKTNNVPFTINNQEPDLSTCNKQISDSISVLTLCSFQYQTRVLLRIGNSTDNEFGIGVRVMEWTDDSESTVYPLDVPEAGNGLGSTVSLGKSDGTRVAVATFLARDLINPFTVLEVVEFFPQPLLNNCSVQVIAGSHPSKNGNKDNLLLELSVYDSFVMSQLFTSVFSIMVPPKCQVRINAITGNLKNEFVYLLSEGHFVVTSPEYPWIFDNPNQYMESRLSSYTLNDLTKELDFDIEVLNLQGGGLDVWTQEFYPDGTLKNVNNISLHDPTDHIEGQGFFSGQILMYSWVPWQEVIRKGFILKAHAYSLRDMPTSTSISTTPSTTVTQLTITTENQSKETTTKNGKLTFLSFPLIAFTILYQFIV